MIVEAKGFCLFFLIIQNILIILTILNTLITPNTLILLIIHNC